MQHTLSHNNNSSNNSYYRKIYKYFQKPVIYNFSRGTFPLASKTPFCVLQKDQNARLNFLAFYVYQPSVCGGFTAKSKNRFVRMPY